MIPGGLVVGVLQLGREGLLESWGFAMVAKTI